MFQRGPAVYRGDHVNHDMRSNQRFVGGLPPLEQMIYRQPEVRTIPHDAQLNQQFRPHYPSNEHINRPIVPQFNYQQPREPVYQPEKLNPPKVIPQSIPNENPPFAPIGEPIKNAADIYKELYSTLHKSKEGTKYSRGFKGHDWNAEKSDLIRYSLIHRRSEFSCPFFFIYDSDVVGHKGPTIFKRREALLKHLWSIHFIPDRTGVNAGCCKICSEVFKRDRDFLDHCEDCAKRHREDEKKVKQFDLLQKR